MKIKIFSEEASKNPLEMGLGWLTGNMTSPTSKENLSYDMDTWPVDEENTLKQDKEGEEEEESKPWIDLKSLFGGKSSRNKKIVKYINGEPIYADDKDTDRFTSRNKKIVKYVNGEPIYADDLEYQNQILDQRIEENFKSFDSHKPVFNNPLKHIGKFAIVR